MSLKREKAFINKFYIISKPSAYKKYKIPKYFLPYKRYSYYSYCNNIDDYNNFNLNTDNFNKYL